MSHYEPSYNLFTYNRPDNGPWKVGLVLTDPKHWYVVQSKTGAVKKIGTIGGRINYFDRAVDEAYRRNEEWKRVLAVYNS